MKKNLSFEDYVEGFKRKDRTILSRAITLIESRKETDQNLAYRLVNHLLKTTQKSSRKIGLSGTPGVGKSSFIEAFGKRLTSQGLSIAVLAVDPTSELSGGSILGDKTRMTELSVDPLAFIRPSPSSRFLGGVSRKTKEAIVLLEAFGFDYIFVETVGVGQSETHVAKMTDFFMMLLQPGSGDDLQGIKRGILEVVDMVVVTKDDGDQATLIKTAIHDYEQALQILHHEGKIPRVFSCSSVTKKNFDLIQTAIHDFFTHEIKLIEDRKFEQNEFWVWQIVESEIVSRLKTKLTEEFIQKELHELNLGKKTSLEIAREFLAKI